MLLALTRDVSPTLDRCELTYLPRTPINVAEARRQHSEYKQALRELGFHVISLPGDAKYPDAVFVEDTAVVLTQSAVITRPGAESRRGETSAVADFLKAYRKLYFIEEPGLLDGGDVLKVGRTLFVGVGGRSNEAGLEQLQRAASAEDLKVRPVELKHGLHLKSAVTQVAEKTLLVNPDWVDRGVFDNYDVIEVDPAEPSAANALRAGDRIIYPRQHVRTTARLTARGLKMRPLDMSEFLKAEGGVTCGSLVFSERAQG